MTRNDPELPPAVASGSTRLFRATLGAMSDPRRDVRGNLAVLTPILAPSILALAFFGSAWARAGALGGVLAGSWMAGRRDPPP